MTERKRGGRKPLPAEQRRRHKSFYLLDELVAWVERQPHPSRAVEDAIRAWRSQAIDSQHDSHGESGEREGKAV